MKVKCLSDAYGIRRVAWLMVLLLTLVAAVACATEAPPLPEGDEMALSVSSPAFEEGGEIPVKYTCEGQNISPPLAWSEGPEGTSSFALIVDDPDAPLRAFTHWVIFNLPADTRELAEGITPKGKLASGALQGRNDAGRSGYFGPCPPPGSAHHYRFTLYALDETLDLAAGAFKEQVLEAMEGHVLAQGQLVGTYQRVRATH